MFYFIEFLSIGQIRPNFFLLSICDYVKFFDIEFSAGNDLFCVPPKFQIEKKNILFQIGR